LSENKVKVKRDGICRWLEISAKVFYKWLDAGLPAKKIGGVWTLHVDEYEDWVKGYSSPPAPDGSERS